MEILKTINFIISVIFVLCYFYQFLYIPVPLLKKLPPHKQAVMHKLAVLICARNEQTVISDIIDSINNQTYPQELITVFVLADNCDDSTAKIAAKRGAVVYERHNKAQVGKGYALNYLLNKIKEDYKEGFDGYIVFDADNILEPDYIENINKTFSDGYEVVTSYRNSKNYGDNWISAGYALWFLRESRFLNNARAILGTSCAVSGTGFLFSSRVLEKMGGWNFFLLTEDIEFSIYNILNGVKIGFCPEAVLYDEQPVRFKQSWRQRMRWSKGYLQVFRKYGLKLINGIGKFNFSCYDMSMAIMPAFVLSILSIICNTTLAVLGAIHGDNLWIAAVSVCQMLGNMYLTLFAIGAITTVTEWKKIYTTTFKKILYTFTFPLFMFTYVPISFVAFFAKVEWKPIEHTVSAKLVNTGRK